MCFTVQFNGNKHVYQWTGNAIFPVQTYSHLIFCIFSDNNKADDPKLVKDSETETAGPLSEYDCSYDHEVGDRRKRGEAPLKKTDNDVSLQEGESLNILTIHRRSQFHSVQLPIVATVSNGDPTVE